METAVATNPKTTEAIDQLTDKVAALAQSEGDIMPAVDAVLADAQPTSAVRNELVRVGLGRLGTNKLSKWRTEAARTNGRDGRKGMSNCDFLLRILNDLTLSGAEGGQKMIGDFTIEDCEYFARLSQSMVSAWQQRSDVMQIAISALKKERAATIKALSMTARLEVATAIREAWAK